MNASGRGSFIDLAKYCADPVSILITEYTLEPKVMRPSKRGALVSRIFTQFFHVRASRRMAASKMEIV